jgi:curved DNA-binding protein CbpA
MIYCLSQFFTRRLLVQGGFMSERQQPVDHYETLQISPNADPDTIQRVFRLLAQRFHPDNKETGNATRFRALHDAYSVLSVPEKRAQYDVHHQALRQERWRFVATSATADNEFEMEQQLRCTILEILYARRRAEPGNPAFSNYELSQLTGRPREHLEFTIWYLAQKKFVTRDDSSGLTITVDGVDFVEQNNGANAKRRLTASASSV